MPDTNGDDRSLIAAIVGDGRPLLLLTGLSLALAGAFALFLSASGHFLPHDVAFLGMLPDQLCAINECRIVHFMVHDRVSFGGTLIAIGVLYMWLTEFPLRQRQAWAWWVLLISGLFGFSSFMAYLGYGYLDTWHGVATLALLPSFVIGLARSYFTLPSHAGISTILVPGTAVPWTSPYGIGRACLLVASAGLVGGGLTIMTVGVTCVFVPQDLDYIGLTAQEMAAINPRLVPLIAHDRAGFGGGVATCGVTLLFCVWCATPSRNLWQALSLAGFAGFATAIGVHPAIGYTDALHLAPAVLGAAAFALGVALCYQQSWITAVGSTLSASDVY